LIEMVLPVVLHALRDPHAAGSSCSLLAACVCHLPDQGFPLPDAVVAEICGAFLESQAMRFDCEDQADAARVAAFLSRCGMVPSLVEWFVQISVDFSLAMCDLAIALFCRGDAATRRAVADSLVRAWRCCESRQLRLSVTVVLLYLCLEDLVGMGNCPWEEMIPVIVQEAIPATRFERNVFFAALFVLPMEESMRDTVVDRLIEYLNFLPVWNSDPTPSFEFSESNPMVRRHPLWGIDISEFCRWLFPHPDSLPERLRRAIACYVN
jgi:hypothetical protein